MWGLVDHPRNEVNQPCSRLWFTTNLWTAQIEGVWCLIGSKNGRRSVGTRHVANVTCCYKVWRWCRLACSHVRIGNLTQYHVPCAARPRRLNPWIGYKYNSFKINRSLRSDNKRENVRLKIWIHNYCLHFLLTDCCMVASSISTTLSICLYKSVILFKNY